MDNQLLGALLGMTQEQNQDNPFVPAKMPQIRELLEATAQEPFQVGDIVVLRDWAAPYQRMPKKEEKCIVTQVLAVPFRGGETGTMAPARAYDLGLAFIDPDGDVVEFLFDKRAFKKVGSIYDPLQVGEEVIPVE